MGWAGLFQEVYGGDQRMVLVTGPRAGVVQVAPAPRGSLSFLLLQARELLTAPRYGRLAFQAVFLKTTLSQ